MTTSSHGLELREGRLTSVGGMPVVRVLPTRMRRTVGPWCFVDCMTPTDFDDPHPLEVGPHPHIGLSTVTWLFEGEALHGDSLGTEQLIQPGQLNLMTAGNGIAHAELGITNGVHGVQLWLAQDDATRHGDSRFQHHTDLPSVEFASANATLMIGSIAGLSSPARTDEVAVGMELRTRTGTSVIQIDPSFEHAVVPIDEHLLVCGEVVDPGWLAVVPPGTDTLTIAASGAARAIVVGGVPMQQRIQMWWNFVARSKEELTMAWQDWQADNSDRFGPVDSKLARIDAPRPPWLPLPK